MRRAAVIAATAFVLVGTSVAYAKNAIAAGKSDKIIDRLPSAPTKPSQDRNTTTLRRIEPSNPEPLPKSAPLPQLQTPQKPKCCAGCGC